mgnify:CR=1 FL=1
MASYKIYGKYPGHYDLTDHFLPGQKAVGTAQHDFQIIIQKSDDPKPTVTNRIGIR